RAVAGGGPVQVLERLVFAQPAGAMRILGEKLQFLRRRHCRGAAMARYHESPASIAKNTKVPQWGSLEPAAEEPGHEGITGSQDVENVDAERRPHKTFGQLIRDLGGVTDTALRTALEDDERVTGRPNRAQRRDRIRATAENV